MKLIAIALVLGVLVGCGGPAYRNAELRRDAARPAYRFDGLERGEGNSDETFICLTFSGGGTRAAALAYGVLQELRETTIPGPHIEGRAPRLLDEVDFISSVSGGSFTAAAYGLWADAMFDGRFEARFLRRKIQTELVLRVLSPRSLLLLPFIMLDRIDIAADYFDTEVFGKRTYADYVQRNARPYIVINACNVAAGERFEFTQDDFDMLGSDLASVPLGYAVAASSAVPILFSPIRFRYYANEHSVEAIRSALTHPEGEHPSRVRNWAEKLVPPGTPPEYRLDSARHRYLYLLDGGVTDNLGLASVIAHYRDGIIRSRLRRSGPDPIRRLVIIVVNAGNQPPNDIESRDSAPGLFLTGYQAGTISVNNYSLALMQILKMLQGQVLERARAYREYQEALSAQCTSAPALDPPLESLIQPYVVEVDFNRVRDEQLRNRLMVIPTSLELPGEQIDDLIRAGRGILRENPQFQQLLEDLRGSGGPASRTN